MSNGSQSTLNLFSIQSTIYKYWILSILFENKYKNFRYMYQLQNYTNVGYSNLKNLKNLKNYGSLTLRTIEKRWQFHGKTIALTFLCLNKYPNYPKSVLHHNEPQ